MALPREPFVRRLTVDLFEPPQREAFRVRALELLADGLKQREVATMLGIAQPAVQNAVKLAVLMDELGISNPYVPLTEPPADIPKLRRHLHPRYRFTPLSD